MVGTLSLKIKWILFICLLIAMAAALFIGAMQYMETKQAISRLALDAKKTAEIWSKEITTKQVKELMHNKNRNSKVGQKLEDHFNRLSRHESLVTHGYIFGAELKNGMDTRFVAAPTALADAAEKNGVKTGGFYTQPANIANVVEEMKKKKTIIVSEPYTDDYGTWLTVVKPYVDEQGDVFAYYGIDYDVQPYMDRQRKVLLITGSVLLVLVLAVVFLFIN